MSTIVLQCAGPEDAAAVAARWDLPGQGHRAVASGSAVTLAYCDKRYPLDAAGWAAEHGLASDEAAGHLIGQL